MSNFDLTKSKIESVTVKCPNGEKPIFYDTSELLDIMPY